MKNSIAVQKARQVRTSLSLTYPVDLGRLCATIGITIIDNHELDIDGYLYKTQGQKYIFVNANISRPEQKRFIIAHELGHYFLHTDKTLQICAGIIKGFDFGAVIQQSEHEANDFASEILLPTEDLCNELPYSAIDFQYISMIAQKYNVSMTAAAIKCVENSKSEREMLICYHDKCVKWYAAPSHAPFFVKRGAVAPPKSIIREAFENGIITIEKDSPMDIWRYGCKAKESIITVAKNTKLLLLTEL